MKVKECLQYDTLTDTPAAVDAVTARGHQSALPLVVGASFVLCPPDL